jgi:Flp pilus assembly protein TadD
MDPDGTPFGYVGVFTATRDMNLIAMRTDIKHDPFQVVYHEYTHFFLDQKPIRVPLWLHEGMAEYFSTFRGNKKKVELGRPVDDHLEWLGYVRLMSLGELFSADYRVPGQDDTIRTGSFYAQSWAFYHFLRHGRPDLHARLTDLVRALNSGLKAKQAFESVYGIDYREVQKAFKEYLRAGRYVYQKITLTGLDVDDRVHTESIPRADLLYSLGNYLIGTAPWQMADAEEHIREALRLDPTHARALTAMAILLERAGLEVDAQQYYERAIGLDSGDDYPSYCYAMSKLASILEETTDYPEKPTRLSSAMCEARQLLQEAIQLNPNRGEAHAALGETYLFDPGNVSAGIQSLHQAQGLMPARMDVVYHLVLLYLRKGDREAAEGLTEHVLASVGDPKWLSYARSAILQDGYTRSAREMQRRPPTPPPDPETFLTDEQKQLTEAINAYQNQDYDRALELLDPLLRSSDPMVLSHALELSEKSLRMRNWIDQVNRYNEAARLVRAGDAAGALAILESLAEEEFQDPDLEKKARDLLKKVRFVVQVENARKQ